MNRRPNPGPLHVISIWQNHVSNKMKLESLNNGEGFEARMIKYKYFSCILF